MEYEEYLNSEDFTSLSLDCFTHHALQSQEMENRVLSSNNSGVCSSRGTETNNRETNFWRISYRKFKIMIAKNYLFMKNKTEDSVLQKMMNKAISINFSHEEFFKTLLKYKNLSCSESRNLPSKQKR